MFALWYLSLALDEIRKHLGWSSIFDIFKTNKTANNKVLDNNKPSSTINAAAKKEQPSSSNATNSTKIPENAPKTAPPAVTPKAPEPKPEPPKPVELPKPTPTVKPSPPPTSAPTVQPQPESKPQQPQPQSQPETKSPTISSTDTNRGTFANDPLDKKLFAPSNPLPFENGNDTEKPNANIKDATTSFLAGEGSKAGFDPKSKQVQDFTSQR